MKLIQMASKSFLFVIVILFLSACDKPSSTESNDTKEVKGKNESSTTSENDHAAITQTLHGFFTWYDANVNRLANINFINEGGSHTTLNRANLQQYLSELKKSGFVSEELVKNETRYYEACEKAWSKYPASDEVLEGMDADRFYCAQDVIGPYNKGNVSAIITGDHAKATLSLKLDDINHFSIDFELKKEGAKWLLSKLGCDTGVDY